MDSRTRLCWKDNSDTAHVYWTVKVVNVGAHLSLQHHYPHVVEHSAKILCNFEADSPHVSGRLGTGRKHDGLCGRQWFGDWAFALAAVQRFLYTPGVVLSLAHKVIFEAVVGDGFLGDIAIDEVKLLTESCSTSPNQAKAKNSTGPSLEKSAIVGHLSGFKLFLLKALADTGTKDRIWVPCYRALTDGKDVREFYKRCAGRVTLTIVRVENYIFGGYTDKRLEQLSSLNNNQGTDPKSFYLKTDRRHSAHFAKSDQGPTFGDGDLVLETMSSGYSELGNSFDIGADAAFSSLQERETSLFLT
ncbi:hypothetical protein OS493_027119 [Desmophyllum pertusum]|uniref:MAM domain-containing protein n=1 Tax=Desmophyllum pertusum TaxID=174260 RepID=A0A9X0D9P5_9CNID|nr:hypothetical protein OS493_027119 [Desmophyllum pertusum]